MKVSTTDKGDLLPVDETIEECSVLGGCSLVGDERGDENLALHSMHTLWVREHNRIAKKLKIYNPDWSGDRLYDNARKIVGGIFQKIVFKEWLPKIAKLETYSGYNKNVDASIANVFSTAAFRFGHSLIPNEFTFLDKDYNEEREPITLRRAFLNRRTANNRGIESTMLGLIGNRSNAIDNRFVFGVARRVLLRTEERRADLLAYNIQRGRDHGLATYGEWAEICGFPEVTNDFESVKEYFSAEVLTNIATVYSSPRDIDIFVAGISEKSINGFQVGRTFNCIIGRQFTSLRDGDRFYYENEGVFTPEQLIEIKKVTMARVMCDNLREIVSIQRNVFDAYTSTSQRIQCNGIPEVDLKKWSETEQLI